jgi:hypothetical protein
VSKRRSPSHGAKELVHDAGLVGLVEDGERAVAHGEDGARRHDVAFGGRRSSPPSEHAGPDVVAPASGRQHGHASDGCAAVSAASRRRDAARSTRGGA